MEAADKVIPKRTCNYYNPETHATCMQTAKYIVALDFGNPGDTGVMSAYRCEEHCDTNGVWSRVLWDYWYMKHVLGVVDKTTDWDIE